MKGFYCLLLLLCPYLSFCQPVKVGDKAPEIVFSQVLNSKAPSIRLSQLKGKMVLLDFWASWCSNCIKKFNLLDSMQRQHGDKLQVILVSGTGSRDSKEHIAAYLKKHLNAAGKPYSMPAAYNDALAKKYFPHTSVPHYVWIGADGRCLAITGSEDVTAANIGKVLKGETPDINGLALMEDFVFEKPLFMEGNAGEGNGLVARSTLSRYIHGIAAMSRYRRNAQRLTTQYKMINLPLLELLKKAYRTDVRTDRIIFEVADSIKRMLLPETPEAKRANSYAYELICPPLPHAEAMAIIQQDMQRYFGLALKKESRPAACYLLTVDSVLLLQHKSKGGAAINKLFEPENRYLQNETPEALGRYLDGIMGRYVKMEATIPYRLDLPLPDTPPGDDAALIKALGTMGIILTPAVASIEQFIIYQTKQLL
jgi:thiol-disulfide isomerase/thioredoxin